MNFFNEIFNSLFILRKLKENKDLPPPKDLDFNIILKYFFIYLLFLIFTVIMIILIVIIVIYIMNKIKKYNNENLEETNFRKVKNEENKYSKLSIKKENSFEYEKLSNNSISNNIEKNNKNNYTNQIIEIVNTAAPIPNI